MSQILEFVQNHAALTGTLAGLIGLFYMLEHKRSGAKISPSSLGGFLKQNNARLIDVREPKDFRDGHISGSENIPFSQIRDHLESLKNSPDPLVLVCKMGQTAGAVGQMLGKDNVYRLDGGILGWQSAGLPLVRQREEESTNRPYRKPSAKTRAANEEPEIIEAEIVQPQERKSGKAPKDTIEIVAEKIPSSPPPGEH